MGFESKKYNESAAIAYYVPHGFYIRLEADAFNEQLRLKSNYLSLFFHEYMHLLQDRTTLHGAIGFLQFINGIQSTFKHTTFYSNQIQIPMKATLTDGKHSQDGTECWLATTEIIENIVSGQNKWPSVTDLRLIDKTIEIQYIQNNSSLGVPSVVLLLADSFGQDYSHPLTAWEIYEGSAMAIDKLLGGKPPSPIWAYEYHIIETIFRYYFPISTHWHIATVCQWSLQSPAPPTMLFSLLDALKIEFVSQLPEFEMLFDFCKKYVINKTELLKHIATATDELRATVSSQRINNKDNGLSALYNWYAETTIADLNTMTGDNPERFPLGLLKNSLSETLSGADTQHALTPLFSRIPVPMIDQDARPFFALGAPNTEVESVMLLRCITTIVNHIWSGTDKELICPLYDKCKLACKEARCKTAPWKNIESKGSPCAFGYAGATFNITGKSFYTVP